MKKFIFYSLPGHGHTYPTLNVARELVKQGNKVIFYSIEDFRNKIESAGIEYRSYNMDRYYDPIIAKDLALFARKIMELAVTESSHLIKEAEIEKPDCIVHDTICLWGKIVGHSLQIPSVSLFTFFAFNSKMAVKYPKLYFPVFQAFLSGSNSIPAFSTYIQLCKKYGIPADRSSSFLLSKENLNLVFTSTYFQPCSNSFNKTYKFVGPSIYPREDKADFLKKLDKNKKLIYISMGTIFNDNVKFFQQCVTLFEKTEYQVVITLGHRLTEKDLPPIPSNIIVQKYVPQLEVLKRADIFINHAGMNGVSESLWYGVPMILIPQMYEQVFNAFRVQELGAGIYLKQSQATPVKILEYVNKIISTESYYANAKKIKKTFETAGGYKTAADEIINYLLK